MARTRDAEQAGAARRARIIESALAMFAAYGYRGTSLAAVAKACGITQSGLLHHFPSKEALLTAVLAERDQQTLDAAEVGRDYEGSAFLRALDIVDGIVERNQQNRALARLGHLGIFGSHDMPDQARTWAQERQRTFHRNLTAVVANDIAGGELRSDTDPGAVASILIATISGLEEQWLLDESFDMVSAMRTLTDILRRDLVVGDRT